jgi:hypothetical protein
VAPLTILVLGTESPEAQLGDVDFARWLEYGGGAVVRIDPEAAYRQGGMAGLERALLQAIQHHSVRILVYPLGMEFDFQPSFFRDSLQSVFRVLLLGDDEHYFDVSHRYYAQCFDFVLSTNPLCERYRLYGVAARFLPGTFSRKIFQPVPGARKEINVSFVGAMDGKVGRRQYAQALATSGIDFSAYGAGTVAGVVSRAKVVDIFRASRINLNFTGSSLKTPLDADLSINRRIRQVKGRCSMIALCGSFVLSEYAPGIEALFDVGKEIDVFHDEKELIEKIRFYLDHEELREQMARRSYERAVREYDEEIFGRQLAAELDARARVHRSPADQGPVYVDRQFWSGFGAWRFKYLVIFLFAARPVLFVKELFLLLRTGHCKPYAAFWFAAMGLLVAARTSRLAAWLSSAARWARQSLRRRPEARYG